MITRQLTPEELHRLAEFFMLLSKIDRRLKRERKQKRLVRRIIGIVKGVMRRPKLQRSLS